MVVVIFLALALFLVFGGVESGVARLTDDPAVDEDVAAAQADFPQVGGTAPEHVKLAQRLAAEETGPAAVRAYHEYRKALSLDADNDDALLGIAAIYPLLDREGVDFPVDRALTYCDAVAAVYPADPRPYRVKARLSMGLRGWEGGIDAWNRVLVMYPDDAEALLELGRCLMELGRTAEATAQLERVVSASPDPTEAYLLLAENHRRAGDFAGAFSALGGVPARGHAAADAAVLRARVFEELGEASRAAEQVRVALRHDGNHPGALLQHAVHSYQDEGDLYNAREDLLRILNRTEIEYEPELRDATALHLGIVYRMSGHHDQAHRYLDPLVAREPDALAPRFHWVKVRLAEGTVVDLVVPFEDRLRAMDCQRPEPWFLLGQLCSRSDDLEGLVRAFEKAIDVDPTYAPAYFSLVAVLLEYGNLDEIRRLVAMLYAHEEGRALGSRPDRQFHETFDVSVLESTLEAAAKALETQDPSDLEHLQLRALVRLHLEDAEGALPILETLVTRGEGAAIHRLYLARAALDVGRFAEAVEQLTAAVEDRRSDPLYLYLAHRLLEAEGRAQQAAEGYERILDLMPRSAMGFHGQGRLAHRAGDHDEARALYTRAHEADAGFHPAWRDHLLLDSGDPPDNGVP